MLKPFNSQISIFLTDGVMNPSKFVDNMAATFNNLFETEIYSLNLENAPSDMPLVRYSSKDENYVYDFAKKRINFYLNFNKNIDINDFDNYKDNIYNFVTDIILKYSDISRVGIAINYYIDKNDDNHSFWAKKYNLPFFTHETSEISYTINNNFVNKGLKYNKIITLTSGKINNIKSVPIVSIDLNNVSTEKLDSESLKYIFNDISNYKSEHLMKDLHLGETKQ